MPTLQGTVQDANGSFCQRLVRAHRRDTGALVAEGLSHPATGAFSLTTADTSKHYVVVHDNDAWITYLPMLGEHNSTLFGEWGGKAVTAYGDARLSTTESKFGGSAAYFDGAGDYLSLPASADLAFGTGDFTLDAWVRLDSLGVERAIFDNRAAASDTGLYFGIDAANHLTVFGNNASIVTGTVALTAATWHHVALVKAGGTLTLYRDGAPVGSAASAYAITCPGPVLIGRKLGSSSNDFAGYIDELIVRKGKAGFGAGFAVPTVPLFTAQGGDPAWSQTVLACHFTGANESTVFADLTGRALTPYGNARISTVQSPFGNGSLYLDGSGDSVKSGAIPTIGTGVDFTVEFFVFPLGLAGHQQLIANDAGNGFACSMTPSGFVDYGHSLINTIGTGTIALEINAWSHIAFSRQNSVLKQFINGVLAGTFANPDDYTGGPVRIGSDGGGGVRFLNGYFAELRITIGAGRYATAFTPPSEPFLAGTATFGQQNALIYDHLTPV